MLNGKFATLIACIDGRAWGPAAEWIKSNYKVDYVDLITAPGADTDVSFARGAVEISVGKHGAGVVAVAGHEDCAGNPVTEEQHKRDVQRAVREVRAWGLGVEVVGLWVYQRGGTWQAEKPED